MQHGFANQTKSLTKLENPKNKKLNRVCEATELMSWECIKTSSFSTRIPYNLHSNVGYKHKHKEMQHHIFKTNKMFRATPVV